ncbi:response regulator transcription factor [Desulfopila sp. IMCC35006]|uniref:response regulator transcription factor n=1 Tax=Desulfopila sp. IMCC35006 TaxID=2569542 RepID=UPI0010ABAEC7|nr:response regulator transcription factor [Desulfopila sp. IMCC35006]TKB24809.1 response regulator transcription factor [Desulfopila sp. IMCC35006]
MSGATVFIIGGENKFYLDLQQLLSTDEMVVYRKENFQQAMDFFELYPPHMVVLDCPEGVDGLTHCQTIRTIYPELLMLISERKNNSFHKLALDLGADSSMACGDGAPLVAANIKALLRRFIPKKPDLQLKFGRLTVDARRRDVFIDGQAIALSTVEFQLFWSLAQKAGSVVSREVIHQDIYNTRYNGYDRSIDLYISRIRQKIGNHTKAAKCLKTVRGVGYQFIDDAGGQNLRPKN